MNSYLGTLQSQIWGWILSQIYRLFPTQIGALDDDLESDIRDGLLYVGVRFRTFNNSFGNLVYLAAGLFAFVFLFVAPFLLFSTYFIMLPSVIFDLIFGVAGILLIVSMIITGFADLLLLLYVASLARFAFQKIQPTVNLPEESSPTIYESKKVDVSEGIDTPVKVYKSNLEAAFRLAIYSILCLSLIPLHFFSEPIAKSARSILDISAMQRVSEHSYIPEINGLLESLDALLPIDLMILVSPESVPFLKLLIFSLLVFSIFLSWKNIYQHAVQSQFEWSEYDEFLWNREFWRCWSVAKITMYHFLYGNLSDEFNIIKGHIAQFPIVLTLGILMTYLYLLIISGTV